MKLSAMIEQVDELRASLLFGEGGGTRPRVRLLEANNAQAAIEQRVKDTELSLQRQVAVAEEQWAERVACQRREAENKFGAIEREVDALMRAVVGISEQQQNKAVFDAEPALEPSPSDPDAAKGLLVKIAAVRLGIDALHLSRARLELEKTEVDGSWTWRVHRGVRRIVNKVLRRIRPGGRSKSADSPQTANEQSASDEGNSPTQDDLSGSREVVPDPMEQREIELILASGLFDSQYYLGTYTDVAAANIDPLSHYLDYGWERGTKPF